MTHVLGDMSKEDVMQKDFKERTEKREADNITIELSAETEIVKTNPIGVVTNCSKLNVRKNPDASDKSNIICEIPLGAEVTINAEKSTRQFWAVTTTEGAYGFCMKEYVNVIR